MKQESLPKEKKEFSEMLAELFPGMPKELVYRILGYSEGVRDTWALLKTTAA